MPQIDSISGETFSKHHHSVDFLDFHIPIFIHCSHASFTSSEFTTDNNDSSIDITKSTGQHVSSGHKKIDIIIEAQKMLGHQIAKQFVKLS